MQILSWNVNGLARKIVDPEFISIIKQYDLVFFTETWISKNTFFNFDVTDYSCVHLYGNKSRTTQRGRFSGGITLYYRESIGKSKKIVDQHQNGILWVELDKRLFAFQENVYICCSYVPPSNSNIFNAENFDFFEEIESGLEKYKRLGKCFIVGDLNSRTAEVSDTLDLDMYTADDEMSKFVNIPPRVSKDIVIDRNGRRLIQLCQSTSSIIGNGRLGSDLNTGDFTYHSIHGSSVVDYCILNIDDFYCITGFWVLQPNEYSDHSGIAINLHGNYSSSNTRIQDNHTNKDTARPIKWNSSKLTEFNAILRTKNDELKQLEESVSNGDDTDNITNSLSKILYEIANIAFNNDRQQYYSQKHANVKKVKKNL